MHSPFFPWGLGMIHFIKHFIKLCTEAEGDGITLMPDVNDSYYLIRALICTEMTTIQVLEATAFPKYMHLPFLPAPTL